jgi:cytochrome c oxidase subunit 2
MNKTIAKFAATVLLLPINAAYAAGDADRGKVLYGICATCHGPNAQGMQEMNAPALAGREEWYLVRQLQNFKAGVRGGNADDVYGRQMAPMAQVLANDQAIEDVAAFLRTLSN